MPRFDLASIVPIRGGLEIEKNIARGEFSIPIQIRNRSSANLSVPLSVIARI